MNTTMRAAALALALQGTTVAVGGCTAPVAPEVLVAKAYEHRDRREFNTAVIELKNALQQAPEHAEARYLLGITYIDIGDYLSAEKELRRASDLRYDETKTIPALGTALIRLGEFEKARALRLSPDAGDEAQAALMTLHALAALALGETREARSLLARALDIRPAFSDALVAQARLAASENNPREALQLAELAIASAPQNVEAWVAKAELQRAAGDREGARISYRKAQEHNPARVSVGLAIAMLDLEAGKYADARSEVERARKAAPDSLVGTYMHALLEFREGNHQAAREALLHVLKAAPDHLPGLALAGAVETELGGHVQAQRYWERVVRAAPDNIHVRKQLVASFARTGQTHRAMDVLQAGLARAPRDTGLMTLAGELHLHGGDFSKAVEYFNRAAREAPKSSVVRTKLGVSRLALGDTDAALRDLESAVRLDPTDDQAEVARVISYVRKAEFERALEAVRPLEERHPKSPLPHNLKAAVHMAKKDFANARVHLDRALELQPNYLPAAMNHAQLDLLEKNPAAARQRLESILARDKQSVPVLLALTELGPRIGASQREQLDWLERAIKADPKAVQPRLMLSRVHARSGDIRKALDAAQQAQLHSGQVPEVLEVLGELQLLAGEKEQALATYGRLVGLQGDSPTALYRLANAQLANANASAAIGTLRKALAIKPDFAPGQVALVDLEIRAGRYAEAMQIAEQMQKQAPKSAAGYMKQGDVLMAQKKYPQAEKAYTRAQALQESPLLAVRLHAASSNAGKAQEADARLRQWLRDKPEDAYVRTYAADTQLRNGNLKEAVEHYEWLRVRQPLNVRVLNNLAWAYHELSDARALETAERAHKLDPNNPSAADTLGWILVHRGETARGIGLLQKAVAAAPDRPQIRFHLAQAHLKAGDKPGARRELERLVASGAAFPQQAEATQMLMRLRD